MEARRMFAQLQTLARERGYGVRRNNKDVLWWRNEDPGRVFTSSGVGDAWEDIVLDYSSKKHLGVGLSTNPGGTK